MRTSCNDITVDSVYFRKGYKNLFSINPTNTNQQISSSNISSSLSYNEKKLLNNKFAKFNTSKYYGLVYLKQDSSIHIISGNISSNRNYYSRFGSSVIAGPFNNNDLEYVSKNYFTTGFEFEPSYEYFIDAHKIKMKTHDNFWGDISFSNNSKIPSYNDMVLTIKDINHIGEEMEYRKTQQYVQYNNPYITQKGNGCIGIQYEKSEHLKDHHIFIKNILVFKDDNPLFMRIYPADTRKIQDLTPGSYRLFISMNDGSYYQMKDISAKANGINIYQCHEPDSLLKDTTSDKIAMLIAEKWTSSDYFESKPSQKWESEIEIRNTFHKAQQDYSVSRTIHGNIVDESGEAIPGATVVLKGTSIGTITDLEGNYQLDVPEGSWELEVSFIGYESVIIPLSYSDEINASLTASKLALDEVVVIGYGVQNKSCVTGSVTSVNSALSGRVAGVQLVQSRSGSPNSITIRGIKSNDNKVKPLIIVDGVPVVDDYSDIDPSLIDNLEVLKADVATSIYGSSAANGAILITTREGKGIPGLTQRNDIQVPFQLASKSSIRSNFSDMAYWQPNLVTNSNGEATFNTTFPDDITSWRTFALAMGPHKTTGQVQAEVKSFKPLSAQLMVPRFLTQGDSVILIGKSLNYIDDSIMVETSYQIDSIQAGIWTRQIDRVRVDSLPLVVNNVDSVSITYSLKRENGYFDGEKRNIPVVAKGVEEVDGEFFTLNTDTTIQITIPEKCKSGLVYIESNPLNIFLKESSHLRSYKHLCNEQASSKLIALLNEEMIYKYLKKEFKYKDDINKLITRLENSTNGEGLWGWWKDQETYWWITQHVVVALEKARNAGYKVTINHEPVIYSLVNSYQSVKNSIQKLQILKVLETLNAKVDFKTMIEELNDSTFTRTDSIKLGILKLKLNIPFDVTPFVKNRKETLYGSYYWGVQAKSLFYGSIHETLLMYKLLKINGGYEEWLPEIRNFFFEKRKETGWRNTYESALIMDCLIPDELKLNAINKKNELFITKADEKVKIEEFPFSMDIKSNKSITVEKMGNQVVFMGWNSRSFNENPVVKDEFFGLQSHFEKENEVIDSLVAGERVNMIVDITVQKKSDYLMLEIPIPSVCSYYNKPSHQYNEAHREYFKDKVYVYYNSLHEGKYSISLELVPRYSGKINLNPARMEQMYFPVFYGNNAIKTVPVISSKEK